MSELERLTRRRFVKMVTFGTATSALGSGLWRRTLLADVQAQSAGSPATLKIQLSDFPALLQNGGKVRLGVTPVLGTQHIGDYYPMIITRDDNGDFHVLDSMCTHAGCVVDSSLACFCHGSRYTYDGSVSNPPATQALAVYDFDFDGNNTLTIQVPNLTFDVTASVLTGVNDRFSLSFRAAQQVTYQLNHRQRTQDSWVVAPFATTPSGAINQTSLTGDGQVKTIYVDRANATGFYAVGVKVMTV